MWVARASVLATALLASAALGSAAGLFSAAGAGPVLGEVTARAQREPLEVARLLAARYPENVSMSYIPALAWSGAFRLTVLTGENQWQEKAERQMQPFLTAERPALAAPYVLTNLGGLAAFSDLYALTGNPAAAALARDAADLILPQQPGELIRFPRDWTDDMFMATSLLARVGARDSDGRYASFVGGLLFGYAERLQRPDGLFVHSAPGPFAWGRGNGFAALALVDALTFLPADWADRPRVLEIYRRQMRALAAHQSDDGSWRNVIDEPESYRELTITAMTITAMARGVRLDWLDPGEFLPIIERGWAAVDARVDADGGVRDACASTAAGTTLQYYLDRPVVNGADDRAGALVMLAALELEELRRAR